MAWCCQARSHYLSHCWPRFWHHMAPLVQSQLLIVRQLVNGRFCIYLFHVKWNWIMFAWHQLKLSVVEYIVVFFLISRNEFWGTKFSAHVWPFAPRRKEVFIVAATMTGVIPALATCCHCQSALRVLFWQLYGEWCMCSSPQDSVDLTNHTKRRLFHQSMPDDKSTTHAVQVQTKDLRRQKPCYWHKEIGIFLFHHH